MSHFGVPHTVNHAASGALRRNGKAAMSRIDRSKSRSAGGKGFYIALALCLAAVGAIGYFTLIRPANVTIDDPPPPPPRPPGKPSAMTPSGRPRCSSRSP